MKATGARIAGMLNAATAAGLYADGHGGFWLGWMVFWSLLVITTPDE